MSCTGAFVFYSDFAHGAMLDPCAKCTPEKLPQYDHVHPDLGCNALTTAGGGEAFQPDPTGVEPHYPRPSDTKSGALIRDCCSL